MAKLIHDTVVKIVGPIDDLRATEIIGTGASEAELVEAKRWVAGYKRTLGDDEDLRPSVVTRLCDILRAEEPEWYEPQ
jgi:hypothetical protein